MKACLLMVMGIFGWAVETQAQMQAAAFTGTVLDSLTNKPLEKAVVNFVEWGKKDTLKVLTDEQGHYKVKRTPSGDFWVLAGFVGYRTKAIRYPFSSKGDLGNIALSPKVHEMQEIVIEAPAVTLKTDTVEYRADAYPVRKDAVLEDLLKKLPGLQVDKNGNIIAYGRPVVKIRVNGKDFFLGDPQLASQNIPAEVIEKIQVIDDKSDQAKFSGFDDGERTQIINITIKKSRSDSYFGNVSAGVGTDDRYLASVRVFRFDHEQQLAVIGNSNNTNGSNVSSGNTTGGPGINNSNEAGFNFSGKLAPHLTLSGSYNFSANSSTSFRNSVRTYYVDTSYTYDQDMETISHQQSHSVQFSLGYGMGKCDTLIFSPNINYSVNHQQTYNSFSFLDALMTTTSTGQQNYASSNSSPNLSGVLTWMHRFDKVGRTLSASASAGPGPAKETDNNFSTNHVYYPSAIDTIWQVSDMRTQNQHYSLNAYYTEPLGRNSQLEADYSFGRSGSLSGKNVYDVNGISKVFNDSLSNSFNNIMTTNRLGIKFMEHGKTYNYQLGVSLQPTDLNSRSVIMDTPRIFNQQVWQIVPSASMYYQFTTSQRVSFYYNGSTQQPSINQLQPVPDYTNPLYIAEGNPNLKPSFNHNFRLSYNDIDKVSGRTFFVNAFTSVRQNAIVNDIAYEAGGKQVVQPVNVNGNYSVSGSYDYSIPFDKRRYVFSLSGSANYANNVSLYGGVKNTGRNWTGTQNVRLEYDLGKWLELTTYLGYSINNTAYTQDTMKANNFSTWNVEQDGRIDFWKDFSLRYTFNYTINQGLSSSIGKNVVLMSGVLEKRVFHEKGILALSVNDLFDDNVSFSHTSIDGYVEDDRTSLLNRFFMLSFTWKFQQIRGGRHP